MGCPINTNYGVYSPFWLGGAKICSYFAFHKSLNTWLCCRDVKIWARPSSALLIHKPAGCGAAFVSLLIQTNFVKKMFFVYLLELWWRKIRYLFFSSWDSGYFDNKKPVRMVVEGIELRYLHVHELQARENCQWASVIISKILHRLLYRTLL